MSKFTKILSLSLYLTTFLWASQSCKPTKYLKDGEVMLKKLEIKGNRKFSSYDLEEFYRLKPNRKFFLLPYRPYMHAYYYGESIFDSTKVKEKYSKKLQKIDSKHDSSTTDSLKIEKWQLKRDETIEKRNLVLKEGNWLMRSVGSKISVYDSTPIANTALQQQKYLHSKGHFRASVEAITKIKNRKAKVIFKITERSPYIIRNNKLICEDSKLKRLINQRIQDSYVKEGMEYSDEALTKERERLTNQLKSSGYFYFHRKFIHFELDSNDGNHTVKMRTIVSNPQEGRHEIFKLKNIYFTSDAGAFKQNVPRDSTNYKGITYLWYKKNVDPKILARKIKLKVGDLYSYDLTVKTQKNLADLSMYKFVNINYFQIDSTNELACYISTSPFTKFQFTSEWGVNVFQGLPGPFGNVAFKARNLFTGAEILDINVRAGIEGQTSILEPDNILTTQEYGLTGLLSFPSFFLPKYILRKFVDYNPKTQFRLSGTITNRSEFSRDNLTSSFSYLWQKTKSTRSVFTPMELTLINTRNETELFSNYISELEENNNPLYLSFRKSIISSLRYDFFYDNNLNRQKRRSSYFRFSVESGGTTLNFIQDDVLQEANKLFGLDYYQYLKGLTDYRHYIPTKNKNILATRVSLGVAKTVGGTEVLPYEKYFFSGGSYSNRAWLPRRLGPGSYTPTTSTGEFDTEYRIEQPGEILFESNIEYRFRLKGVLDGAVFTDIGNVWTINNYSKEGAQFTTDNFLGELAVGAGFGFRFDFSFLILRLDLGSKIWDPALEVGSRFTPGDNSIPQILLDDRLTVLNLGIGYPF